MSLIGVQAPNGSGKSRILIELLSVLSSDTTASLIAFSGNDNNILYQNLDNSVELLNLEHAGFLQSLSQVLESTLKDKQHVYILIDDLEELSNDLIDGLLNLLYDNPIFKARIILVAFMSVIPEQLNNYDVHAYERITLQGMSIMQVKEFIDKVYSATNQKKELTMSEVSRLHGLSYGYIGRLIKLLEQNDTNPNEAKSYKKWWIFIALLVVALIALFFWFQNSSNNMDAQQEKELLNPPVITEPVVVKKEIVPVKVVVPIAENQEVGLPVSAISIPEMIVEPAIIKHKPAEKVAAKHKIAESKKDVKAVVIDQNSDKKTMYNYVIELGRYQSKVQLEESLKGRSIPGKVQFAQIDGKGSKVWVAYIGPYSSEDYAKQGKDKLPASLQNLPLKVRKEF